METWIKSEVLVVERSYENHAPWIQIRKCRVIETKWLAHHFCCCPAAASGSVLSMLCLNPSVLIKKRVNNAMPGWKVR